METQVLIIGTGIAGGAAALQLADAGVPVTLITRATQPEQSNTFYAQGGIIYRGASDTPDILVEDILRAGAGHSYPAAARILALCERLDRAGIALSHIDLGGGFGIRYRDERPAPIAEFLDGVLGVLAGRRETLVVDPGRAIVGDAGVLLTRV